MLQIDIIVAELPVSVAAPEKFSTLFYAFQQESPTPWWLFWLLAILFVLSMVIWWVLQSGRGEPAQPRVTPTPVVATETVEAQAVSSGEVEPAPAAEIEADTTATATPVEPVATAEAGSSQPAPAAGDDLKRIEGIGPKISDLLKKAGITTFTQLASTEINRLEQILDEADLEFINPETWPEQAKLAAADDWEALTQLQKELKGGRRVQGTG